MREYEILRQKKDKSIRELKDISESLNAIDDESIRVANIAKDSGKIIADLDREFESITKLNKTDIAFLLLATALQCVRMYLLTGFKERLTDKEAARKVTGINNAKSIGRNHKWYNPSLEEILSNPVSYDATFGSPDFNLNIGGPAHRFKTLGHDPLLGWIFGTANILTSTLTTWDFQSYHVKTGYTISGVKRDRITNKASTKMIFDYSYDNLFNEGSKGKVKVGASVTKHSLHLKSDMYTKVGLPLPIIGTISPETSQTLANYGIDAGNMKTIGKQVSLAIIINILIAMIHGLFYDKTIHKSRSLYEVKTRKILLYSNSIASGSNVIYVAISKDLKNLDIGGLLVTLHRIISDTIFVKKIKQEFLEEGFYNIVLGEEY